MDYSELLKGYRDELVKLQNVLVKEREDRENDEKKAIDILKKVKEQFEHRFQQVTQSYEEKIKNLESSIKQPDNSNSCPVEIENLKKKLEELEINSNHKENEISNLKLDLRMAQRDNSRNQDQVKFLRENNRKLKEKLSTYETEIKQFENKDSDKSKEVNNLKEELSKNEKLNLQKIIDLEAQKIEYEEKIKVLQAKCTEYENAQKDVLTFKNNYEESSQKYKMLEKKYKGLEDEKSILLKEIDSLKNTLTSSEETISKLRNTNSKLKDVCTKLEEQSENLQNLLDEQINKAEGLIIKNDEKITKIQELQSELHNNKIQSNLLNEELISLKNSLDKQKEIQKDLELKLSNEIENNSNYSKEINRLENECFSKDIELRNYEEEMKQLINSMNEIKEEASQHITMSENLKSQNYSLAKMYDDLYTKYTLAKNRISTLLEENDLKDSNFEYEKLRFQETINQQYKLIDHIQNTQKQNSKKSWFGLSDKEQKIPLLPSSASNKVNQEKELESAFQREVCKNKILMNQIAEIERSQNKRKKDRVGDKKKIVKINAVPTAPPVSEEEDAKKKLVLNSTPPNQNTFKTKKTSVIEEEEFTFTDSIMEELAYITKEE